MSRLVELLCKDFGSAFPVSKGSATRADPLVIVEQFDYVAVEYFVARLCLDAEQLEYELEEQRVHDMEERTVDELVYAAKPKGAPQWTQTRRFFFDISAGYRRG